MMRAPRRGSSAPRKPQHAPKKKTGAAGPSSSPPGTLIVTRDNVNLSSLVDVIGPNGSVRVQKISGGFHPTSVSCLNVEKLNQILVCPSKLDVAMMDPASPMSNVIGLVGSGLGFSVGTDEGGNICLGDFDAGPKYDARVPGWEKGDFFSPFEARISVSFHSFRLIFGRETISRGVLEEWTLSVTHFIAKLKS